MTCAEQGPRHVPQALLWPAPRGSPNSHQQQLQLAPSRAADFFPRCQVRTPSARREAALARQTWWLWGSSDHLSNNEEEESEESFWGRGTAEVNNLEGLQKLFWECLDHESVDQRLVLSYACPESLCYFDVEQAPQVRGYVALTLDDAPGRFGPGRSRVKEVGALLRRYGARATFFVMSDYLEGHEEGLKSLCQDGNELQNHGARDRPYYWESEEDFQAMLLQSQARLDQFGKPCHRWFRAPKGLMSSAMKRVLQGHGYKNVMFDRYALDTEVDDPAWIAEQLLHKMDSGSIALVHMPEQDFREWNLEALELVLKGLQARQLRAVTVSELAERAAGKAALAGSLHRSGTGATHIGNR
mmetsp:Transcript_52935/g.123944  ORF Transcript_52935/g.123944 Transcript_52935/m.123944 type:complete len:357 (+) Transcript_52935:66-1136(+)